jgi:glycogen debranching enzyme
MTALVRARGTAGRKAALRVIEELRPRLAEAGIGSLPEVFDAEAPHSPHGCIARATSVAEVLRAWVEDLHRPAREKPGK